MKYISLYVNIDRKKRLWGSFILCPVPMAVLTLVLHFAKFLPRLPELMILLIVPYLLLCVVAAAVFCLWIYEWYCQLIISIKNVFIFNLLVLVGGSWAAFSNLKLAPAFANYIIRLSH